jgi:transketolase
LIHELDLAKLIRKLSIQITANAGTSHIGSCLSVAEILAVCLINCEKNGNVLILSKGHAAAALYSGLFGIDKISFDDLMSYCTDGSNLIGHVNHHVSGVRFSSGSLGHGLPVGVGMALSDRSKKVFVIMSDGELNEGTTWESLAIAKHQDLDNLVVIVDVNAIQSFGETKQVLDMEPLVDKFQAFGSFVSELNGHSTNDLIKSISETHPASPRVILARTVKGKGIREMENKLEWHYKSPLKENLNQYFLELEKNA